MKVLRKELKKNIEMWNEMLETQVLKLELNLVVIYWFMAREKRNPESKWKPYMEILPETYPTPIFWTPEELREIEGTNLHGSNYLLFANDIPAGAQQIRHMLENMFKLIKASGDDVITLEDLFWAYSAFSSRAVGMSLLDNRYIICNKCEKHASKQVKLTQI